MKSFKKHIAEVAQPKSPEEKAFKDQHNYEVIPHPVAEPHQHSGAIGANDLPRDKASRPADQKGDAEYDKATPKKKADGVKLESTEQDRARYDAADDKDKKKVTLPTAPWDKKKKEEDLSAAQKKIDHNKNGKIDGHDLAMLRKKKKNEEVEQLDELSPKTMQSYQKKADKHAVKAFDKANDIEDKAAEKGDDVWSSKSKASNKHSKLMGTGEKRSAGAELARKKLIAKGHKSPKMSYEEVEQLDELSPETLKSYKKKAMKQYKQSANKRQPGGGDFGSATKSAQDKHQKRFDKRHKGIGSEIKRTTDSDIHLKDPKGLVRKDPKSNSMTGKPAPYKNKAESYVAEDMNKVHTVDIDHTGEADSAAKKHNITLKKSKHTPDSHSASGKKKDLQKYLAHHYDSADDAKEHHPEVHKEDFNESMMDKIKNKAADIRRKTLGPNAAEKDAAQKAMMKKQHDSSMANIARAVGTVAKKDKAKAAKNETTSSAIKHMVTQTGPDGKTRTVQKKVKADRTDDRGQDIIGEAVRFKKGPIRLKNGKQVMVSDEDAKLLTKMFKDLNPRNQKAMHKVMLMDPAGFEEIRGFAREAL